MNKNIQYNQYVAILLFSCALASPAFSQQEMDAEKVEKIEVTGMKDPSTLPYKFAYDYLEKYYSQPHDRIALNIRVMVDDAKKKSADLKIRLVGKTVDVPIPITPDGRVEIPFSKAILDDDAEFITNRKKGLGGKVEIGISLVVPPGTTLHYSDLVAALAQTRSAAKGFMPWWIGWLLPTELNAVQVAFDAPANQTATVMASAGNKIFRANEKGTIVIVLDDRLYAENPKIVLSAAPKSMSPDHVPQIMKPDPW